MLNISELNYKTILKENTLEFLEKFIQTTDGRPTYKMLTIRYQYRYYIAKVENHRSSYKLHMTNLS